MQADPEAAKVVFEAGAASLTMIPLEVQPLPLPCRAVILRTQSLLRREGSAIPPQDPAALQMWAFSVLHAAERR